MKKPYVIILITCSVIAALLTLFAFQLRNISPDPTPPLTFRMALNYVALFFGITLVLSIPASGIYWAITAVIKRVQKK